jgi:hypothetical protein
LYGLLLCTCAKYDIEVDVEEDETMLQKLQVGSRLAHIYRPILAETPSAPPTVTLTAVVSWVRAWLQGMGEIDPDTLDPHMVAEMRGTIRVVQNRGQVRGGEVAARSTAGLRPSHVVWLHGR